MWSSLSHSQGFPPLFAPLPHTSFCALPPPSAPSALVPLAVSPAVLRCLAFFLTRAPCLCFFRSCLPSSAFPCFLVRSALLLPCVTAFFSTPSDFAPRVTWLSKVVCRRSPLYRAAPGVLASYPWPLYRNSVPPSVRFLLASAHRLNCLLVAFVCTIA